MENTDIIITETGNYEELIPLFRSSGLEIHAEGGKPQNMITCWRADDRRGNLLGGVSIERKKGLFVIGDIAVEKEMRGQNIGGCLLGTAMKCIRQMGGRQIYLVAKAPNFLRSLVSSIRMRGKRREFSTAKPVRSAERRVSLSL